MVQNARNTLAMQRFVLFQGSGSLLGPATCGGKIKEQFREDIRVKECWSNLRLELQKLARPAATFA
jgi:hypothetical protein